jgi:hypothetical protein
MQSTEFFTLKGKHLYAIAFEDNTVRITTSHGIYELRHEQDGCERVWLDEVNMSKMDVLVNCKVTTAERECHADRSYFYLETEKGGLLELHWLGQTDCDCDTDVQCWRVEE